MRAYVINLDRSPERLAVVADRLEKLGIEWHRVSAIDGRTMAPPAWPEFDAKGYSRARGKAFNPAKLACYLSHVKALKAFLEDGGSEALILEDDAVLPDDLSSLIGELESIKKRWDVVLLDARHKAFPVKMRDLQNGRHLVTYRAKQTGSAGYIVSRYAAERYAAHLLPMSVPYDHEYTKAWKYGLRIRGVIPRPVHAQSFPSTIGYAQETRKKFPWWKRIPVVTYELRTETARVLHYLFRDTEWMGARLSPRQSSGPT